MTKDSLNDVIKRAKLMLRLEQPNAAINLLRVPESRQHAELAALLAEAYFMRGDTKGDVYASCFFASRAMDLGHPSTHLQAILGIGAFRKQHYTDAVKAFSTFVSETSSANTHYVYGLSLLHANRAKEACHWLSLALETDHLNPSYVEALEAAQQDCATESKEKDKEQTFNKARASSLGGLHDQRLEGETTPYRHHAVSKLAGEARSAKDRHWLAVNIPCQEACPAKTDIPQYLTEIYHGRYDAAYRINLLDNVFPAVLGRVCARPCEPVCRHGWENLGDPVAICFSKRSAADFKEAREPVVLKPIFESSGKSVGVVGSGVAGLTAARELARFGHRVTVYEQHHTPGGMMNQGIPVFRLPRETIDQEVEQIRSMGVTFQCNQSIGKKGKPLQDLCSEHDAVVLAAGTLRPNMLNIPGAELQGIRHGLDFLLELNDTGHVPTGENFVVIGGGFTAMDCARCAKRLNAEATDNTLSLDKANVNVNVYYRRSVNEMLVTPGEIEELEHENIGMFTLVSPVAYLGDGQRVTAVRFIRNQLGTPDASGRRRPEPIAGSEFDVPADWVLLATGQFPDTSWIDEPLRSSLVDEDQWLKSGKRHQTKVPTIFIAGDFAGGASSLIEAIGHAKACARTVDEALTGKKRIETIARIEDVQATGRIKEMDDVPLQVMPTLPLEHRTSKSEVETGFTEALAIDETQRCYRCHFKYEIDSDKCIYCDWCVKAKPRPDCIVKVSSLTYGDEGQIVDFERSLGSEDTHLIYINQEDCIRCNACVDACPVDCISIQKVSHAEVVCGVRQHVPEIERP